MKNNLPKAIAAEYKLKKINSDIVVEGVIEDVNANNIVKLCEDMDLILDATDNLNIRYLINDVSIKLNIPWIYGAVIGSNGMTHTIIPINKSISTDSIVKRLKSQEIEVKKNKFFLKFEVESIQFTLFYDGRAILKNVSDTAKAKTLYSKYIGF